MIREYILQMDIPEDDSLEGIEELVRCKDCKHYSLPQIGYERGECLIKAGYFPVKPDLFCADGERRLVNG